MENDNQLQTFIFTFGIGMPLGGWAQVIIAENIIKARAIMCSQYSDRWAFCYTQKQWDSYSYEKEKLLPVVIQCNPDGKVWSFEK